jgi:hypothetical protein
LTRGAESGDHRQWYGFVLRAFAPDDIEILYQ